MAKITDRDVTLTFGNLVELRTDGWISTETAEDAVVALAQAMDTTAPGGTGEIELIEPGSGDTAIMDFEVDRSGIVNFALRRKCECGEWRALCHP